MSNVTLAPAARIRAAGLSDVGRARDVNEDRFHADPARGIFLVVDGVGGQAAGGKAADTALAVIRERLESTRGPIETRVREAITAANNEIHRLAAQRPEWHGMACVLTLAVVGPDRATVGHVGDTRLYTLRHGRLEKVTPDHSPVGEREDARELTEDEAMRHPRRNEVYRDVGSEHHDVTDRDFVDVRAIHFDRETALLLCSDGLTDLVPASEIRDITVARAGRPTDVVSSLVDAANAAGGKDNVTVVYVEGDGVLTARWTEAAGDPAPSRAARVPRPRRGALGPGARAIAGLIVVAATALLAWTIDVPAVRETVGQVLAPAAASVIHVRANESIAAAMDTAPPGASVVVAPGEYRERLVLKDHVRLLSRVPRGAVLRPPATASDADAAVLAVGITGAEFSGFKILGDALAPLGTGVLTRDAMVRLADLEIAGARRAAVDVGAGDETVLTGSDLRDNPGALLIIRTGAAPRIAHNTMARPAGTSTVPAPLVIEAGANPVFSRNVFLGVNPQLLSGLPADQRAALAAANWFLGLVTPAPDRSNGNGARGRQFR